MNQAKILHNIHGIRHSSYSLIAVEHDLRGPKDGTWQAEVIMQMAWCEAITRTAARQIAISMQQNKYLEILHYLVAGKGTWSRLLANQA